MKLLGLSLKYKNDQDDEKEITSVDLWKCLDYQKIKDILYHKIKSRFFAEKNFKTLFFDNFVFLEFVYFSKHSPYYQFSNIICQDCTIIDWESHFFGSKLMYTFGQYGCLVIIIPVNHKEYCMAHYSNRFIFKENILLLIL